MRVRPLSWAGDDCVVLVGASKASAAKTCGYDAAAPTSGKVDARHRQYHDHRSQFRPGGEADPIACGHHRPRCLSGAGDDAAIRARYVADAKACGERTARRIVQGQ